MELTHQFTIPASPDETWAAFNDVTFIADCFPGATVTSVDGDQFEGTVRLKVGPISLQYAGTASVEERNLESRRIRIRGVGRDKRGQGTADATVTAVLGETSDGTHVNVLTELAITGKPAQFGRGMIEDVSERLLSQFLDAFSTKVSTRQPASTTTSSAAHSDRSAGSGKTDPTAGQASEPTTAAAGRPSMVNSGEIKLLSTVLPVVARRYAGYVLTAAVFLTIGWLIGHSTL